MDITKAFAILAPVPEIHLKSGLEALAQQIEQEIIPPFVAYGSMDFEVFGEVEKLRNGKAVEVLIYAAEQEGDRPLNPEVMWKALYVGCDRASGGGKYRGKAVHRPASTAGERAWGIFWKVTQIEVFKSGLPIGKLQTYKTRKPYPSRFVPEGPVLIDYPYNQQVFLKK